MKSPLSSALLAAACIIVLATLSFSQDARLDDVRRKADAGDPAMQFWLGVYYESPRNLVGLHSDLANEPPNYAEALKWLEKAAAQGRPEAMTLLGQMYEDGEGVPQNETLAALFYRMSCAARPDYQSASHGCNQLAVLYDEGRGVVKNPVEAYKYYVLAELPPDDLKRMAEDLTPVQLAEAQRRIEQWWQQHPSDVQMMKSQPPGK
jgi:Sel1 repeat